MSATPASPADVEPLSVRTLGGLDLQTLPSVLARLVRLAWRYRALCLLALSCALGSAVLNLLLPQLLGHAVDQAHHLTDDGGGGASALRQALWASALLLVGATSLRGLVVGLQGYLGESIAQRVGQDLRLALYDRLQRLGADFHDATHSGDLIARGMLDLEGVRGFLETGLLRVVTLVPLLGLGAWRLIGTDTTLGLLALAFVPFVVWRATRMGILLRLSWQKLQRLMSDLTLGMEENLQGQRLVRAFVAKAREMARYDRVGDAALRLSNQRITLRMSSMSQMNLAFYTSMGLVLYVGGQRVAAGTITVGLLSEFLTFMTLLQQPVRQIGMIVNSSARAAGAGTRLFEVLDAQSTVRDAPDAQELALREGVLKFESVGFSYGGGQGTGGRLFHLDFEVRPGQTLGIVGPPGSGKSTLAQLIPRLRDVTSGRITIDGQDIRHVSLASLRRRVALVPQDAFLFDASAHDNIAYATPQSSPEQTAAAATAAQLHEQIQQMPMGYGSRVGERGIGLSGGQRQRMTIARALRSEARIVVLDDASSAIDAATEKRLREALRAELQHHTVLIIAHRLVSVQHADEILMLDAGRIAERGTHEELLSRGGAYAALWAIQHPDAAPAPQARSHPEPEVAHP